MGTYLDLARKEVERLKSAPARRDQIPGRSEQGKYLVEQHADHGQDVHLILQLDSWEEAIDPPPPCPQCGSLELWETLIGTWRCLRCDAPIHVRRLEEKATHLRAQSGDSLLKTYPPVHKMTGPSQVCTSTRPLTTPQT